MKISRRNILKTLPALCAPTWLTRPSFASTPTQLDRHFVFVYFGGGWDNLISLDPRDPDIFTADRISETGIEIGYEALDTNDPLVQTDIGLFGSFSYKWCLLLIGARLNTPGRHTNLIACHL